MVAVVDNTIGNEVNENNNAVEMKDLAYFEANPEEMPTDIDAMQSLLAGEQIAAVESNDDIAKQQPVIETNAEVVADEQKNNVEAVKEDVGDKDPEGILMADGKTVVKYDVLKNTRAEVSSLKGELGSRDQEIIDLKDKLASVETEKPGVKEDAQQAMEDVPLKGDGSLDVDALLAEGYDQEVVDLLSAMNSQVVSANSAVTELTKRVDEIAGKDERNAEQIAADASQAAIDKIPGLAEIQSENSPRWKAAITIDNELNNDPAWAGRSMDERFAEVAKQIGITVTDTKNGDIDKGVAEALAGAKKNTPRSISDLEGGEHVGQGEFERMSNLAPEDLGKLMESWAPEKIERYLAQIG